MTARRNYVSCVFKDGGLGRKTRMKGIPERRNDLGKGLEACKSLGVVETLTG